MKILQIIANDDYDALTFESNFSGEKVSDIIPKVKDDILIYIDNEGDANEFMVRIIEVGEIDERFLEFVRKDVQDYDDSKHSNFYLENQVI